MSLAIVWFRRDLRLIDNPAVARAAANHKQVLGVYIHAPDEDGEWAAGGASRWWLHHALQDLNAQLDGNLLLCEGPSLAALQRLAEQTGADAVYWNRQYEAYAIDRDKCIKQTLRDQGLVAESDNAALLFEPWEVKTKQGGPYRVFTPFWKRLLEFGLPKADAGQPSDIAWLNISRKRKSLGAVGLDDLKLLPTIAWAGGIADAWQPSRAGAEARLDEFLATGLEYYDSGRDYPMQETVSRLSPYLHFGQLGPREIVAACGRKKAASAFLRELGWREFAHHLLFHFPHTSHEPLDERFADFPWRKARADLNAWQRGRTGIPIVDAGMRQLWVTGWMHNRVRMIVASLLTKNLLLPWQHGAQWFWDTLVDADLANNSLGWQWTAGSGADAAPYFRIFNPVSQGEKFDAGGEYVRRWVPELKQLSDKWIHRPWEAPTDALHQAGITLGEDYPSPIVDLKESRKRALSVWEDIKNNRR